jgi:hypothetical protein
MPELPPIIVGLIIIRAAVVGLVVEGIRITRSPSAIALMVLADPLSVIVVALVMA